MDRGEARHLVRRTGGDSRAGEVDAYEALTRAGAVDRALDFGLNGNWSAPGVGDQRTWEYVNTLARDWVDRWATVARPFEQKLLLFFHHHLTVHRNRIKHSDQMHEYLTVLRSHLLGDYRQMVKDIALSPAMLLYLDNHRNRVGKPNENFARELMEIHLIGPEHYSQNDVAEAARAWTGYTLDDDDRYHRFEPSMHDDREKTILGVTRRWNGLQLIDHIFTDPTLRDLAARHLITRFWLFMTASEVPAAVLDDVAPAFVSSNFNIRTMVRAVLLREEFFTGIGRNPIPRAPMEYIADLHRVMGLRSDDTNPQWVLRQMGQMPFHPPNPLGWDKIETFISASAFLTRAGFIRNLAWKANGDTPFLDGIDDLTPGDSVLTALRGFGVEGASTANRRILEDYVVRERGERGWSERVNLITTVSLSPDVQVG
ncbi:MAG: DUF1800 family protein [Actinomycetota bacterium]